MEPEPLDLAVRAYTPASEEPTRPGTQAKGAGRLPKSTARFPEHALIFDTETTVDQAQQLNFGAWRYCRVTHTGEAVELRCLQEGIFYADDLPTRDPEALATLTAYVAERRSNDDKSRDPDGSPEILLQSQTEFCERVLFRVAYRLRGAVVCFNFPFDISRIAWTAGPARRSPKQRPDRPDAFESGFSFALFSYLRDGVQREGRHRPRIAVKSIDSKRALKGFRSPAETDVDDRIPDDSDGKPDNGYRFRGELLDLRTLVFALTDRSHSLESASAAYDVPYEKRNVVHGQITTEYVTYCREDVEATQNLTQAAVTEFLRHPIALPATRAYSPATIGKEYLKRMGIPAPSVDDPVFMGQAMSAYYGGRAECRIRRTPVPVVYCDFKSMYPTVCSLMGISKLLTSEIQTREATEEVRALLDEIDAERCFKPSVWSEMVGFAQIVPNDDVLPVRAAYGAGPNFGIGVNHLTSDEPMWFAIPDLIASKLLTGRTPTVIKAVRLHAGTQLPELAPVSLLGDTPIDPSTSDFFTTVIEQRTIAQREGDENRSKGLKTLANATSYGIYAQMTRRDLGQRTAQVNVYGYRGEPFQASVNAPEEPGNYCYPPFAAVITAAARLLLAWTEREFTSRGGTYAFCDTDSMAIVATQTGGPVACEGGTDRLDDRTPAIHALSWQQVDEIAARFESLNPYDREIVPGSILELESENRDGTGSRRQLWCFAISAKRYTFYTEAPEGPRIVKPSQHGLGHLLNPTDPESAERDWIDQTWEWLVRQALDLPAIPPAWLDVPAVGRMSVSSPHLHQRLELHNHGLPYARQIKPFGFLILAFVGVLERPADEQNMVLMAPYSPSPATWLKETWINRYNGKHHQITTTPSRGQERLGLVTVKTYGEMLTDYATHPEPKSAAPDGARCNRRTRGLLGRRHVRQRTITHIGKEANSLDSITAGLVQRSGETQTAYEDTSVLRFQAALPALRALGPREISRRTGISVASVHGVLSKDAMPRRAARAKYLKALEASTSDGQSPLL